VSGPVVSVVIPARDAAPTLARTLAALEAQTLAEEFEVILVDDGSTDETPELARAHPGLVRLIRNESSQGPGEARNRGAGEAQAPVLAFTDADCFPTPEWLERGLEAVAQADLIQGRVDPDPTVARTPFDRSLTVEGDRGFYQTANLFVRRETFHQVGGFRDWVLEQRSSRTWSQDRRRGRAARTPIGEDTVFGWSALRLGARSAYAPEALVHHAVVPGSLLDEIADRWHWSRDMAGLARRVPELRDTTFYHRVFFNSVSAQFDLALLGLLATAASRKPGWMAAGRPYLRHLRGSSHRWAPQQQIAYLLGSPLVDLATLCGLVAGSVSWRSLIL
jgi:glycosyltransferase involved in cell wall biosynthesis